MLLIARTDSESGRLVSSNVDAVDHEFVLGTTTESKPLAQVIADAETRGASASEIDRLEKQWMEKNTLCTLAQGQFIDIASK